MDDIEPESGLLYDPLYILNHKQSSKQSPIKAHILREAAKKVLF